MRRFANDIKNRKATTALVSGSLLLFCVTGAALAAKPAPGHPAGGAPPARARGSASRRAPAFRAPVSNFHPHFAPRVTGVHPHVTPHNFAAGRRGRNAVSSSVKTNAASKFAHVHNGHGPKTTNNAKTTNNLKANTLKGHE